MRNIRQQIKSNILNCFIVFSVLLLLPAVAGAAGSNSSQDGVHFTVHSAGEAADAVTGGGIIKLNLHGKAVIISGGKAFEIGENFSSRRSIELPEVLPLIPAVGDDGSRAVIAGGVNANGSLSDKVNFMTEDNGRFVFNALPDLPVPLAGAGAAFFDGKIYVFGGAESLDPMKINEKVYSLDILDPKSGWQADPAAPAGTEGKFLPRLMVQNNILTIFGGFTPDGGKMLRPSPAVYQLKIGKGKQYGWKKLSDMPSSGGFSSVFQIGVTHYGLLGALDKNNAAADWRQAINSRFQPAEAEAENQKIQIYSNVTDRYFGVSVPKEILNCSAAVDMPYVFAGAGDRQLREPGALFLSLKEDGKVTGTFCRIKMNKESLNYLDYLVILFYVVILVFIGLYFARKNTSADDYFVGGHKMPMWVAAISAQAAGASGITMMALPAMAYQTNLLYWGTLFAGFIPTLLAAILIIPILRKLNIISVYEYIEMRFCRQLRQFASFAFLVSLLLIRLGVVTLLPAMAIGAVTGLNVYCCIIITGVLATSYTAIGGLDSVAWCDVFQFAIMTIGAIICAVMILSGTEGGLAGFWATASAYDKLTVFDFSWDWTIPTVWLLLITSPLNMFSSGSDQGFVQRVMAVKSLREAKQVTVNNFLLAIPVQSAMWIIGVGLFVFFYQHPELYDPTLQPDSVFPQFIVQSLPMGVRGLMIIGIVAASVSTLDAGINSAGAVMVSDFLNVWFPGMSKEKQLRLSRVCTLSAGIIGTLSAVVYATFESGSLWVTFSKITALIIGGFPSIFMLGMFTRRANTIGVVAGYIFSMLAVYLVMDRTDINFVYDPAVALASSFAVGYLVSFFTGGSRKNLDNLTVFTAKETAENPESI